MSRLSKYKNHCVKLRTWNKFIEGLHEEKPLGWFPGVPDANLRPPFILCESSLLFCEIKLLITENFRENVYSLAIVVEKL